jgi:signal transduction histidine kinase
MSLLELIKLIGFATAAGLHLYMCWLLLRRRGIRDAERVFLWLAFSIGIWHFGNFLATLYSLLVAGGTGTWLRAANTIAFVALAFQPPLLIHAHLKLWDWVDPRTSRRRFWKHIRNPVIWAVYAPMALLPWVVKLLWSEPYQPPIDKLHELAAVFIAWYTLVLFECAAIDGFLSTRMRAAREQRFFQRLAFAVALIGLLFLVTYVAGGRNWPGIGEYLEAVTRLSSVVPTAIVAYYIYRYHYLELVIRQSFIYAGFAAAVMLIYVFGIRRLSSAAELRYGLRPGVIESLLILGLMFLAGPLLKLSEKYVRRLFAREVGLYRELVMEVGVETTGSSETAQLVSFVERRLGEALELRKVSLIPATTASEIESEACRIADARGWRQIEDAALLAQLDAITCECLWRDGRVVGLLAVGAASRSEMTTEKREVLAVLAGHLAVAVENCELLEEKVKLERQLAARERLATLGQMAATVAHEVRNPLSSIKSIAQVMREDEEIGRRYARDLDLITGEVDRLSRSVTQLLSFSRPGMVAAPPGRLSEIISGVMTFARTEADGRRVECRLEIDLPIDGNTGGALKEILLNLVLNAIQAAPIGGHIELEGDATSKSTLRIAVSDDGPGIPESEREQVFEPFFTTKQRGTGLGLAIVKRRIRDLDGSISVMSPLKDGRGTRFEISLPVNVDGSATVEAHEEAAII